MRARVTTVSAVKRRGCQDNGAGYPGTVAKIAPMDDEARRQELKVLLRSRREALKPEALGMLPGPRRRTPGLRREEVAAAAGVGITWYSWLEQGRDISASRDALRRIARALRLSPSDEAYLLSLGGFESAPGVSDGAYALDPHVQAVLDDFRSVPAFVLGPALDVLAFNPLGDAIYDFGGMTGPFANNHVWRHFLDPKRRALFVDWEDVAANVAGWTRMRYGHRSDDTRLNAVLAEVRESSPEFRRFWNETRTAPPTASLTYRLRHPRFDRLSFSSMRFTPEGEPDVLLIAMIANDSTTTAALGRKGPRASRGPAKKSRAGRAAR